MTREEATAFYRKHYRRIFNISLRIVESSADAEEIMQDTLLKYISNQPEGLNDAQESAWLARTAIRKSLDWLRSKKREAAFLHEAALAAEEVDDTTEEIDTKTITPEQVAKEIGMLKEPYNLVLDLVLIEGLDYEEVSQYTGITQGNLRCYVSRGMAKLREALKRKPIYQ